MEEKVISRSEKQMDTVDGFLGICRSEPEISSLNGILTMYDNRRKETFMIKYKESDVFEWEGFRKINPTETE
nr:hypothetical protein [Natribacillus halophilus]